MEPKYFLDVFLPDGETLFYSVKSDQPFMRFMKGDIIHPNESAGKKHTIWFDFAKANGKDSLKTALVVSDVENCVLASNDVDENGVSRSWLFQKITVRTEFIGRKEWTS